MTKSESTPGPLTYRDAGVDIDAGERLVDRIGADVAATRRPEVLGGLGGFGGLFALDTSRFRQPVLVAGTDGVGTKLRLARDLDRHDSIGIDLVAMCVNDVIVTGAEPQFFLDYYATGKLDEDVAATVIRGIAAGCSEAGCALIGGETAEMPGMYAAGDYDLAGFCVGAVERDRILDPTRVAPGDRVLGLAASGPHSNGYSLIRRVLERSGADPAMPCGDTTLGAALMAPTRIYVKAVLRLLANQSVHAISHITGGGFYENLPRVVPDSMAIRLNANAWTMPPVFHWLKATGNIDTHEMYRTFNCGIGLVLVVPAREQEDILSQLKASGEQPVVMGQVEQRTGDAVIIDGV